MTTEDKLDAILQSLEDKKAGQKPKDAWDKAQVVFSAFTGIVALMLTIVTLKVTSSLSERANKQADSFQVHQLELLRYQATLQHNEDIRKKREETMQEITILPTLMAMTKNSDVSVQNLANEILAQIKRDPTWLNQPLDILAKSPKDSTPNRLDAIKLAAQSPQHGSFWVYLGEKENNIWQSRNFDIKAMPNIGTVISNTTPVFERVNEPKNIGNPQDDNWYLGQPIGVLKPNSQLRVVDTLTLSGNNYWARVRHL
jgi:hypothetical protein